MILQMWKKLKSLSYSPDTRKTQPAAYGACKKRKSSKDGWIWGTAPGSSLKCSEEGRGIEGSSEGSGDPGCRPWLPGSPLSLEAFSLRVSEASCASGTQATLNLVHTVLHSVASHCPGWYLAFLWAAPLQGALLGGAMLKPAHLRSAGNVSHLPNSYELVSFPTLP